MFAAQEQEERKRSRAVLPLNLERYYRECGTTARKTSSTTGAAVLPAKMSGTTAKARTSPVFAQFREICSVFAVLTPVLTHTSAIDFFEFGFGFECLASSSVLPLRHDFINIDDGTPDPKRFFDYPQVVRPSPPNII